MRYELYYWAGIQGRGEFVRLALEEAGADYVDVAREAGGEDAMLRLLDNQDVEHPPFAPPYLKAGELLIGQTANILFYLGPHHGLHFGEQDAGAHPAGTPGGKPGARRREGDARCGRVAASPQQAALEERGGADRVHDALHQARGARQHYVHARARLTDS